MFTHGEVVLISQLLPKTVTNDPRIDNKEDIKKVLIAEAEFRNTESGDMFHIKKITNRWLYGTENMVSLKTASYRNFIVEKKH